MVSHKHKCIFIHIPKTGGMSIENAFLKSLGLAFYKGEAPSLLLSYNKNPSMGPPSLAHLNPMDYIEHSYISEELYLDYFKFSIVRNPYDRIISIYRHFKFHRIMNFDSFLRVEFPKLLSSRYYFVKPQTEYLYDDKGKLLVDYVGKFENLNSEFNYIKNNVNHKLEKLDHINKTLTNYNIYSRWNIRFLIKTLKAKPYLWSHLNIKNKQGYRTLDFFSEESLRFINDFYKSDFEIFNYEKMEKS